MNKADLKAKLSDIAWDVTQNKATERPFTGQYVDHDEIGKFRCVCCDQVLFESSAKFDAGCGWPSFDRSLSGVIDEIEDTSHGMVRTEVVCSNCHAHLGHVFTDGPKPTGLRYCINSVSIDFKGND